MSLVLVAVAIATGSLQALELAVAAFVALWVGSTLRHMLAGRPTPPSPAHRDHIPVTGLADSAFAGVQRAGFPVRMIRDDPDAATGALRDTVAVNPNW